MKKILIALLFLANITCMPALANEERAHYDSWLETIEELAKITGVHDSELEAFIKSCKEKFDDSVSASDSDMTADEFEFYSDRLCLD